MDKFINKLHEAANTLIFWPKHQDYEILNSLFNHYSSKKDLMLDVETMKVLGYLKGKIKKQVEHIVQTANVGSFYKPW